jgi:ParB family chromosome partitioning protein
MIDIDNLIPSEDNFFAMTNIEEFAETILLQGGIKSNLIVSPLNGENEGKFEIISGHRRTAAIKLLLEKNENVSRFMPCLVVEYLDKDDKLLDITSMNNTQRILSDSERWKSYEITNNILLKKKENGEKFGKLRDSLAKGLGVSTSQISKIQNIDHNAIDEVKEAVKNGEISIHTATEISKLEKDKQQALIAEKKPEKITPKEVKKLQDKPKKEKIPSDTVATVEQPETGMTQGLIAKIPDNLKKEDIIVTDPKNISSSIDLNSATLEDLKKVDTNVNLENVGNSEGTEKGDTSVNLDNNVNLELVKKTFEFLDYPIEKISEFFETMAIIKDEK